MQDNKNHSHVVPTLSTDLFNSHNNLLKEVLLPCQSFRERIKYHHLVVDRLGL